MSTDLDKAICNAQAAMETKEYSDLIKSIESLANYIYDFNENQKGFYIELFKVAIRQRRTSYYLEKANYEKASILNSKEDMEHFRVIRDEIRSEALDLCNRMMDYITEMLIPSCKSYESLVFSHTARGDTYRYIASLSTGTTDIDAASQQAVNCYMEAMKVANKNLPLVSTSRLMAVLNLAVFNYDILKNPTTSVQIIRSVLAELEPLLPTLPDVDNRALRTIERMQKNLIFWENDMELNEMERKMYEQRNQQT